MNSTGTGATPQLSTGARTAPRIVRALVAASGIIGFYSFVLGPVFRAPSGGHEGIYAALFLGGLAVYLLTAYAFSCLRAVLGSPKAAALHGTLAGYLAGAIAYPATGLVTRPSVWIARPGHAFDAAIFLLQPILAFGWLLGCLTFLAVWWVRARPAHRQEA